MANPTIAVDDGTLKKARMRALGEDTSVNAVLREYLEEYAGRSSWRRREGSSSLTRVWLWLKAWRTQVDAGDAYEERLGRYPGTVSRDVSRTFFDTNVLCSISSTTRYRRRRRRHRIFCGSRGRRRRSEHAGLAGVLRQRHPRAGRTATLSSRRGPGSGLRPMAVLRKGIEERHARANVGELLNRAR